MILIPWSFSCFFRYKMLFLSHVFFLLESLGAHSVYDSHLSSSHSHADGLHAFVLTPGSYLVPMYHGMTIMDRRSFSIISRFQMNWISH